jgi:hypothetical protein
LTLRSEGCYRRRFGGQRCHLVGDRCLLAGRNALRSFQRHCGAADPGRSPARFAAAHEVWQQPCDACPGLGDRSVFPSSLISAPPLGVVDERSTTSMVRDVARLRRSGRQHQCCEDAGQSERRARTDEFWPQRESPPLAPRGAPDGSLDRMTGDGIVGRLERERAGRPVAARCAPPAGGHGDATSAHWRPPARASAFRIWFTAAFCPAAARARFWPAPAP